MELLAKAKQLADMMNITNFVGSNRFIEGIKRRENISWAKKSGESDSVDKEVVKNWEQTLHNEIKDYAQSDVYNLDETALFYRLLPSKTYAFAGETRFGQKRLKDRITLLLITNADGSDRKAIMIGRSKKPQAFRRITSKPIDYYNQSNAWMNSKIFAEIVKKFNEEMKKKNKNVILFMDSVRSHVQEWDLSNVKVKYFPKNTTSVSQPLDQGIIRSFKANYRKSIICRLINDYEDDLEVTGRNINLFDAMSMIDNSWKNVTNSTIKNCFAKVR